LKFQKRRLRKFKSQIFNPLISNNYLNNGFGGRAIFAVSTVKNSGRLRLNYAQKCRTGNPSPSWFGIILLCECGGGTGHWLGKSDV
jgi:hypothetical protein